VLAVGMAGPASLLHADSTDGPEPAVKAKKKDGRKGKKPKLQDISEAQQKQALDFATVQHPELVALLDRLEEINAKEYGRAIRDLYRTSERLRLMADRNPERHALEVSLFKVESRVRLALAQMAMDEETKLEEALAPLMAERRDLKRQILELERRQTTTRLAEIDRQLEALQQDPDGQTRQELKRLKQSVAGQVKPAKGNAKKKADRISE
jgi:hypothetical protein